MTGGVRPVSDATTMLDRFYSLHRGVLLTDLKPGQVAVGTVALT